MGPRRGRDGTRADPVEGCNFVGLLENFFPGISTHYFPSQRAKIESISPSVQLLKSEQCKASEFL